jgi:RNA polymerase sigma factor (sigma-70 family)
MTPLTPEQRDLASKWVPYAYRQAHKYAERVNANQWSNKVDVEDLIGVALFATCETAARFDASRAGSLGTLLGIVLRQKFHHEICRQKAAGFAALPSNLANGRMTFEDVKRPGSVDAPSGEEGRIVDLLPDAVIPDRVEKAEDVAKLRVAVADLPQPIRGIILARMHGWTLAQIGWHLDISKELVRQHEVKGHGLLRVAFGLAEVAAPVRHRCGICGTVWTPGTRQRTWIEKGHTIYCSDSCRRAGYELRRKAVVPC